MKLYQIQSADEGLPEGPSFRLYVYVKKECFQHIGDLLLVPFVHASRHLCGDYSLLGFLCLKQIMLDFHLSFGKFAL